MTKRVVIIGAGPGGLAAAMLLARSGADVTVLERGRTVGGRTGRIEGDGFRFDVGPTFFLYPRILEELFEACGLSLRREVDLIRIDPLYHLRFGVGGDVRMWAEPDRLAAEIARLCPRDAAAIPRYMAENRSKLARFRPVLEAPCDGVGSLLRPGMLKALPLLRPHRTLDQDLARHFRDERVRLAFSFQSKYLGMSPFQCPSLFSILAFLEHEHGVWHPVGGCHAVMLAMADAARRLGATIRTGEAVREILFQGRRAVGVRTDVGRYGCDALVVNGDFARSMTALVPDALRRRWRNDRIARKRFSCSTFMLYLGLEGPVEELEHHTVVLARDYRRNLREIEEGRHPPEDPSLYIQNPSRSDATLAPPGHSALYVLVPVGNQTGAVDWRAEEGRYRARILERLAALGLGNLERRIRFERRITPADWERDFAVHRGATFNLSHTMDQMLHNRPRNRFEDLDGVYLVGGGTHPGSGLPVIFEGARITARLLVQDLGLAERPALAAPSPMGQRKSAVPDTGL